MALQGTLKDFALPDIFQLIGMQRKTGLLTLEAERETVTIVFENGMIVMADSSVRRLDDLLGNVLIRQGKIRKQDLEEVLEKQSLSMQRLGYILTSQGYIDSNALKAALAEQVQQIVFRVFRWKTGQYHFEPSASVDYDRAHVTPVSTDHILMEGIRRVDEWPIIEKRIPSLDLVFRPLVPPQQVQVSRQGGGHSTSLEASIGKGEAKPARGAPVPSDRVVLSESEASVYNLLDGKRSIAAIVDMTGLADFDVSRTLFDLIERNLVAPVGHERRAVAAEPVASGRRFSPVPGLAILSLVGLACLVGAVFFLTTPFRVPGLPDLFPQELRHVHRAATWARMQLVDNAIRSYFLTFGDYPSSLDELVNASPPLVALPDLQDGRGSPLGYDRTGERVILFTLDEQEEPDLVLVHEILR